MAVKRPLPVKLNMRLPVRPPPPPPGRILSERTELVSGKPVLIRPPADACCWP